MCPRRAHAILIAIVDGADRMFRSPGTLYRSEWLAPTTFVTIIPRRGVVGQLSWENRLRQNGG